MQLLFVYLCIYIFPRENTFIAISVKQFFVWTDIWYNMQLNKKKLGCLMTN